MASRNDIFTERMNWNNNKAQNYFCDTSLSENVGCITGDVDALNENLICTIRNVAKNLDLT